MFHVDIYVATKGGIKAKDGRYGWVVEYITPSGETKTREGFGAEKDSTSQRMTLRALIEAFDSLAAECDITLHIPDPFVRGAFMTNKIGCWGIHGGIGAAGTPIRNAELWNMLYHRQMQHVVRTQEGHFHPYLDWLKRKMR